MNPTDLEGLSPEDLEEVLDFAAFLKSKNKPKHWSQGTSALETATAIGAVDSPPDLSITPEDTESLTSLERKWERWFAEVDQLTVTPHEVIQEYPRSLLQKYRQKGLDL